MKQMIAKGLAAICVGLKRGLIEKLPLPLDVPAWQSLGYRELLQANSSAEIARVVEDVKRKTRNYAKRQLTWFRWQVESTRIDMDSCNPVDVIADSLV